MYRKYSFLKNFLPALLVFSCNSLNNFFFSATTPALDGSVSSYEENNKKKIIDEKAPFMTSTTTKYEIAGNAF